MPNLNDKLILIKQARDDIQSALIEQGQEVGKDIRDYAEAVSNIEGGAGDVEDFPIYETWLDTAKQILGTALPYKELEYIESTGTQYIDMQTTNMLTDGCKVLATISMTNPTATFQTLFGAEDGGNPYRRNYLIRGNGSWGIGCYDYSGFNYTFTADTIYEVECSTLRNNGYVKMNGTSIGTYNNSGDRTSNSLYMLAFHQGTKAVQLGSYKIYSFKLYDVNETLIRDFIPVQKKSDNTICLYDKVSGEFFTNQGTGTFVAGPIVVPPYTELEYIESTGTQYIDTGVQVKSGYRIEAKFNHTPNSKSFNAVFGGRTNWDNNQLAYCNRAEGSNTQKMIAYKYEIKPYTSATYTGANVTMVYDRNVFTINDGTHTETQTLTDYTFSDPHTLYIFGLNHNGAVETASMINMKLYYFKIYDYDTEALLRDFVPRRRTSDGAVGLYDKVNDAFYANVGEGDFIAGPEKII